MKLSVSKKFSHREREIILCVLKLAAQDFNLSTLRSLRISPLGKVEREMFGGYAYARKHKGMVKLSRKMGTVDFIEALAHELCHIAQYASGRLSDSQHCAVWNQGLKLPHKLLALQPFGDIKYNPFYWFSPWEREARNYAAKLVKEIKL